MQPDAQPPKKKRATCSLCRRRKVKCDREDPCSLCVHAGVACVRPPPNRLPRGRQGGRRKANSELLQRISKLENLVKEFETTNDTQTVSSATSNGEEKSSNVADSMITPPADCKPAVPVLPIAGAARYLAPNVWMALGDEIDGMREILDEPSDSEDEEDESPGNSASLASAGSSPSAFVLLGRDSPATSTELKHPTSAQVQTLCDVYLAQVDPVVKILHAPSVKSYLYGFSDRLECSPGPKGLESLRFSMYYAAVTSLTPDQCFQRLGEDRGILLARFRSSLEVALARADFVNTEEMSILQALVIFLFAVRSNENTRLSWTLAGLTFRIAQALALHRDCSFVYFPPFEQEMRKRLWWNLCVQDFVSSADRGTDRVIGPGTFHTDLPLHVNDADLTPGATEAPPRRDEFCDMTFSLLCYEVFETVRRLNYVTPGEDIAAVEPEGDQWSQRREMVIKCRRWIENKYLCYFNPALAAHRWGTMIADVITAGLWLIVYRPMQRNKQFKTADVPYPGILHLAVEVMEKNYEILTDPVGAATRWHSQLFVQWHPLAVMLAELCTQVEGPTVERAWNIVGWGYNYTSKIVADSEKGRLWRPIRKLMSRARAVRKAHLDKVATEANMPISNDFIPPGQTVNPPMDGLQLASTTSSSTFTPDNTMQGLEGMQFDVPIDWDPWLVGTAPQMPNPGYDALNEVGWSNWANFVDDFYADGNGSGSGSDQLLTDL